MSTNTEVINKPDTDTDTKTSHYPMYKVLMHNDEVTTMDFVIGVLVKIFNKELIQAAKIMLEVHETGCGLAGVYALEHAEMKVEMVHSLARTQKYPLTCTIESA
jgi:ATP-dependent Clp protease adaptor protein ClpS